MRVKRTRSRKGEQVQAMANEQDRLRILESWRERDPELAKALDLAGEATVITDSFNESQRPIVSYWFGTDNRVSA